jgi:isopentenyl-diphosphate delta-isomerase
MIDEQGSIETRKRAQLQINLEDDVQAKGVTTGLERYRFIHAALPEMDFADVDTYVTFLDHQLDAPILISCMTGGVESGLMINR